MPKLNKALTKTVESAEAVHGFGLLPNGKYLSRLTEVRADETRNKEPMWVAEFSNLISVSDEKSYPGRQWMNLNLPLDPNDVPAYYTNGPEKWATAQSMSGGRLKAFFEAFGYTVDSDTDEMIGEWAVLTIGTRTIQQGARQGEKANQINDIESADDYEDMIPEVANAESEAGF